MSGGVGDVRASAPATTRPAPHGTADLDRADVARVLAGDVERFAVLVDRHQGRVLQHLARLVGRDAAEDLAQDAFVRAYEALGRFDPRYPFRGWLLVIATRLAANHAARRRERPLGEDAQQRAVGGADPVAAFCADDAAAVLTRRVDACLAALGDEARALFELRFRQELPVEELAAHFGITRNAIKVRIHRLRAALAERLGLAMNEED